MYRILYTVTAMLLCCCGFSQTITPIPGWTNVKVSTPGIAAAQSTSAGDNYGLYQVRRQEVNNEELKAWFNSGIQADLQKEKWTEQNKGSFNATTDILIYITEVTDAAQKKWYLLYMGYGFGNKQVRMARLSSTHDKDFFQANGTLVSKHFGKLASQDMKGNASIPENKEENTAAKKTVVQNKKVAIASPGKGVKSTDIHSVIMHLEYESGMGGGIYPVYNAYILFKNGSIYKYPVVSPADLLVAVSKQTEPLKWGTWQMNGTIISSYWAAEQPKYQHETWEKSSYYITVAAKKGEQLEGSFKTLSGGGNTALGGDVMVMTSENISFAKDGKFTTARVAGVSSGRDIWENTNSSSNEAGTYLLDEYTIELRYNNGKTERSFFFFYPDSKKHFGIGQSIYMPKGK
jgi:hypothetical protein